MKTTCRYDLPTLPDCVVMGCDVPKSPDGTFDMDAFRAAHPTGIVWSGEIAPPTIGAQVKILMNRLGTGEVVSYFVEHGFLGVGVRLDSPPDWYRKQNPGRKVALVFGNEITAEVAEPAYLVPCPNDWCAAPIGQFCRSALASPTSPATVERSWPHPERVAAATPARSPRTPARP